MAKELQLEYEQVPLHQSDGSTRTPEYLAVNPNGEIPAIDDDGLVLWESMAINLYLAKKYGGPLAPETLEEDARAGNVPGRNAVANGPHAPCAPSRKPAQ